MKQITSKSFFEQAINWINQFKEDRKAKAEGKRVDNKILSENTIEQYETTLSELANYLVLNDLQKISRDTILDYRHYLISVPMRNGNMRKPSTINVRVASLNKFFKENNLKSFRVERVKPEDKDTLEEIMTEAEVEKLINICYENNKDRLGLLIETLVNTGVRIEELKYFTADKILNPDIYYFKVTNKGKTRTVYLTEELKDKLSEYCKDNDLWEDEVIFHGRDKHKLLNKPTIWKQLKQMAEVAGIKNKKFSCHSYRHVYAKKLANNGMNVNTLANILGHSSIQTTMIYMKNNPDENLQLIKNILEPDKEASI